jgi:bifunctional non-homologous end joining protein LigD
MRGFFVFLTSDGSKFAAHVRLNFAMAHGFKRRKDFGRAAQSVDGKGHSLDAAGISPRSAWVQKEAEVWKRIHKKQIRQTEVIEVDGRKISLINYEKEYWPGISKLQLVVYYQSISEYILPYLQNRPLGLNIVTEWAGEGNARFFRNMKGNYPGWVKNFSTHRRTKVQGKSENVDWVVCNDLSTLIYMLNLGAIDLHPWAAQIDTPEYPDYIVIDLDPDDSNVGDRLANTRNFRTVIKVTQAAKTCFDKHGLIAFVKLSGKTGMHFLLPCADIQYGTARTIAENIAIEIQKLLPKLATVSASINNRAGKIYIDASQNDFGDRLAAPYCVRAYKQPFISAPLDWSEVNLNLNRNNFTIYTMKKRLEEKGDLFTGLFDKKLKLKNGKLLKVFS